jgi:hypothetical protein
MTDDSEKAAWKDPKRSIVPSLPDVESLGARL